MESVYRHFDNDLMRVVIWANQASATQFAQIAPLVIEHVKQETPLALTLIKQAAAEVDRLGSALATQSRNKSLPCSLLGGLARFIEPWLGDSLRSTAGALRIVSGALLMIRKAVRHQPLAKTRQQIGGTMTANNPYRAFVDGFARLLIDAEALGSTPLTRPTQQPVATGARTALIFAPHPDDEVIIGGLPLRLLRELKINVVNVAVTLGSRADRQAARWQELKNCCDYIGFGLVAPAERGLEGINPVAKEKDPQGWSASVKAIAGLLTEHRPSIVFFPHDDDWNQTHIGVHRLHR